MTEPDEATLWVRERTKERLDHSAHRELARQNISAEIDAGKHDDELSDEAQAYRAGQAASAERIKALELMGVLSEIFNRPELSGVRWKEPERVTHLIRRAGFLAGFLAGEADQ
jgi:hypothetical protein